MTEPDSKQTRPVRQISRIEPGQSTRWLRLFVTLLWVTAGLCVPLGCAIPSIKVPAVLTSRANRHVGSDRARLLAIAETFERQGRTAKANEIYARVRAHSPAPTQAAGHLAAIAARKTNPISRKQSSGAVDRRTIRAPEREPTEEAPSAEFVLNLVDDKPPESPAVRNATMHSDTPSLHDEPDVEAAASMMGWKPAQQGVRNDKRAKRPTKKLLDHQAGKVDDQSANQRSETVARKYLDQPAEKRPKKPDDIPADVRPDRPADQPPQPNPFAIPPDVRRGKRIPRDNRWPAKTAQPAEKAPQTSADRNEHRKDPVIGKPANGTKLAHRQRDSADSQREIAEPSQADTGTAPQDRHNDKQTKEPVRGAVPVQRPKQNPTAETMPRHRTEKHYGPVTKQCRPLNRDAEGTLQRTPGDEIAATVPAPEQVSKPRQPKPHTIIIQPAVRQKRDLGHVLPPPPAAPLAATGRPFAPQVAQTNKRPARVPVHSQSSPLPHKVVVDEPRKLAETERGNYLPGADDGRRHGGETHEIRIIPAGPNMKRRLARALLPRPAEKVVPSSPPLDPAELITSGRLSEIHTQRVLALLKQLDDLDPEQRALAAYELGQAASEARTALPVLRSRLRTEGDALARLRIAEAIARIAPGDGQAIAVIADGLSDTGDWRVRELSACLLDVAGPQPKQQVVIKLIGAMNDYHPGVRTMAALTLGSFGAKADAAVPRLRAAARSDVGRVQEAAAAALNVIESRDSEEFSSQQVSD